MKKIPGMFIMVAVLGLGTSACVETGYTVRSYPAPHSYYYYPSANVYFDGSCNRYIYQNGRSWVTASILPSGIFIGNEPRVQVYYNGPEVWRDNDRHRSLYYRQPAVVFYDHNRYGEEKHRNKERRREERERDHKRNYD
jgi:hypothetical protein